MFSKKGKVLIKGEVSKANAEQEFRPEMLNRIFTIFTIFLWKLLVTSQSPFLFTLSCLLLCLFF